jgi:hypothetical protein
LFCDCICHTTHFQLLGFARGIVTAITITAVTAVTITITAVTEVTVTITAVTVIVTAVTV